MFTCELQDSNGEALTCSQAMGLDQLIHPPGCSDPNCLLPSCINIKLRRNHLQTCRKKKGRCDICKILTSNPTDALVSPLPTPPVKPQRRKAKETAVTQADFNITIDVPAGKKQDKILPESQFHSSVRKEPTSFDAVEESPAPRQQGLSMAVLPYVDRTGSCHFQGQNTVQLSTNLDSDCTPFQESQEQVIQSPLEVLCNALQALNKVIQMVTSNQLEMHAIPIFRQALAGMESTVLKRFEGNIGTNSFDNPMAMDYFENATSKVENQWATSMAAQATPMLTSSSSLPSSYSLPHSASSPPPLSASSSSSLSSSLSSSPPLTPPSYDDVPQGTNQWSECLKLQAPSKPMLTNDDTAVEVYGDQLGESSFNLQDIFLLDFAEELLV